MTIRDMIILTEVAKCNNMSAAARNLYISQSTVSQTILDIEKYYHVQLFERLSKKLVITEQGKIFAEYSKKIIDLYDAMEDAIKNSNEKTIRIGTTLITSSSILNETWTAYHRLCSDVKTKIVIDDNYPLKTKLLNGELDFVLTEESYDHDYLICRRFAEDAFVFIFSEDSEFHGRTSVSLKEISDKPLIMREKGNITREYFESAISERGYPFQLVNSYRNIDIIKSEVNDGNGFSVMAKKLVVNDSKNKQLSFCDISDIDHKRYFYLIYHKDTLLTPYFNDFIDVCYQTWK